MKKFATIVSILTYILFLTPISAQSLQLGADRTDVILPLIEGKRVALVVNPTAIQSDGTHLLDVLLSKKVDVKKIFAPEHGFRGDADAGAKIVDGKDSKTGISVVSLYGKNYKPSAEQLQNVDIVIFDIQDVGCRFYTYISTMHHVMNACAEHKKTCIVLDRPNPNDYIDGPILNTKFKSFVGMHKTPILHGLTVAELAQMINGEGWLTAGRKCDLKVVPMLGWQHGQAYSLPVKPSPNLPNDQSIKMYPSLCFFEATNVSVGRGTDAPFQMAGAPDKKYGEFSFTPISKPGATNPPQKGKLCHGLDFRQSDFEGGLSLEYLLYFYNKSGLKQAFFSNPKFMDLLSGTDQLRQQILAGKSEKEIKATWQDGLNKYKETRKKYLLYLDK